MALPTDGRSIISSLSVMNSTRQEMRSFTDTNPRVIVALRLVITLAFALFFGYGSYVMRNTRGYIPEEARNATVFAVMFGVLAICHALNVRTLHRWYRTVNRLTFVADILVYCALVVILLPFMLLYFIAQPIKLLSGTLSLGAFSFSVFYGYKFYVVIRTAIAAIPGEVT